MRIRVESGGQGSHAQLDWEKKQVGNPQKICDSHSSDEEGEIHPDSAQQQHFEQNKNI